jgi:molecular chaperone Hsp33
MTAGGHLRILAISAPSAVEEARRRHRTSPVATDALGRALCGALLLTGLSKGARQVTLVLRGDGPLGAVVADSRPTGQVRGYVQEPAAHLPPKDGRSAAGEAIGRGTLTVTRWLDARTEPYRGTVELVTGGVARDVAEYLLRSEQIPSAVALGVLLAADGSVRAAGGYLVQALTGAPPSLVDEFERRLAQLPPVTHLLGEEGLGPEELAARIAGEEQGLVVRSRTSVSFRCDCDRSRAEESLVALGRGEIESLLPRREPLEVSCHFCGEAYLFSGDDLRRVLDRVASA